MTPRKNSERIKRTEISLVFVFSLFVAFFYVSDLISLVWKLRFRLHDSSTSSLDSLLCCLVSERQIALVSIEVPEVNQQHLRYLLKKKKMHRKTNRVVFVW